MKSPRILILLCTFVFLCSLYLAPGASFAQTFSAPELLGRPTNNSISLNVVVSTTAQTQFMVQYGIATGDYDWSTTPVTVAASSTNEPVKIVIGGLSPNTKYYYRLGYSTNGGSSWTYRTEHSFYTQRAQSSEYKFTITSDGHVGVLLGNATTWHNTLTNVGNDQRDFHIDLGDSVAMDNGTTGGSVGSDTDANSAYLTKRNSINTVNNDDFAHISHSAPLFLVAGNHEQTEGWHYNGTVNSLAAWSINARKRYFLNPVPDAFYSGNTDKFDAIEGDQLLENYYAWNWGDALFIVLDPFWYTTTKAENNPPTFGGGEDTGAGNDDRWDWTLGKKQYDWLRSILATSSAKYKFIFMHHPTGGSDDYIRGGAIAGRYCEWGGNNEDGTTYAFGTRRAGWYAPVHQVLAENKVSAVFHGHDHQYVHETRDGVVYQEVPSAGGAGPFSGVYSVGDHGDYNTITILTDPGHLLVTVAPAQATVECVKSGDGTTTDSYPIYPATATTCPGDFDADGVVDGKDLAALIAYPMNVATFAQNFGKITCP
jgi:hypothetical protein